MQPLYSSLFGYATRSTKAQPRVGAIPSRSEHPGAAAACEARRQRTHSSGGYTRFPGVWVWVGGGVACVVSRKKGWGTLTHW